MREEFIPNWSIIQILEPLIGSESLGSNSRMVNFNVGCLGGRAGVEVYNLIQYPHMLRIGHFNHSAMHVRVIGLNLKLSFFEHEVVDHIPFINFLIELPKIRSQLCGSPSSLGAIQLFIQNFLINLAEQTGMGTAVLNVAHVGEVSIPKLISLSLIHIPRLI